MGVANPPHIKYIGLHAFPKFIGNMGIHNSGQAEQRRGNTCSQYGLFVIEDG
jgi:hypothetical protein